MRVLGAVLKSVNLVIFKNSFNLIKGCSLDLLSLEVGHGVHEVESDAALP